MEMVIKETNRLVSLSLFDSNTGIDNIIDFLANHWAFANKEIEWDENSEEYIIKDEETFSFWKKIVIDQQDLDTRILDMGEDYDIDMLYECIIDIDVDIENFAQVANKRLDDFILETAKDER